mgnify:CR=1 FL=1
MFEDVWTLDPRLYPSRGFIAEQLAFAAQYARLAPSNHNSQPWTFRIEGDGVTIRADRTRALAFVDPDDR